MILSALLLLVFAACIGFLYNEGMWSNAIRLVNVVTAALVAMNFFEPLASWLSEQAPSFTAVTDFLALWALFGLTMVIFRFVTDLASRVNVRFLKIVDQVGGGFLAAWIGWVMVGFTLTTLHTAPLAKNYLFGSFQPKESMLFGMFAPDRQWLGFTQKASRGSFCRSGDEDHVFNREYIGAYTNRRAALEAYMKKTGKLRVNSESLRSDSKPKPSPPKDE